MSLIAALGLDVGASIAKSILKLWLKNSDIAADASGSIVGVLESQLSDRMTQRRAERQLQDIGEKVGESLLPLFSAEGGSLDEAGKTAVALAVAETLNLTTSEMLAQHNLEPSRLAQQLLSTRSAVSYHFSEVETLLYNRCVSESCEYIVDIASQLPRFNQDTLAEILKRESNLLTIAERLLQDVKEIRERLDPKTEAAYFELEYRRAVVRYLDYLELFGTDVVDSSRRHCLSVAYITLSVKQLLLKEKLLRGIDKSEIAELSIDTADEEEQDDTEQIPLSVNDALSDSQRLLIRGAAGSGKTTLLQWIAVRSASQSFEDRLSAWNGTLPFYIRLRQYVSSGLPLPETFPGLVAFAIADKKPEGWVYDALTSGKALVLVDGLDEVPGRQRNEVRKWLKDLVETFPKSRFIVSTRPHAAEEGWMAAEGFDEAELQLMELPDIYAFIDHWHMAVAGELHNEEEKKELEAAAEHLKEAIRADRPKRNLATSPLLCAMLCALNRERRQQLPSDRIELYEACCKLLIERRDKERHVSLTDYPAASLTYRQKLVLLEEFAYWLMRNGWSEVALQRADECFTRKLASIPNISQDISGEDVRKLFIERTGIIREPAPGDIDFTHRTFQEYLAAQTLIEEDDTGILEQHAEDDQWRDVIILASGLMRPSMRERFLLYLMNKGDQASHLRHKLHLLAIACLETTVQLREEVKAKVEQCLEQLIPPQNITEAKVLATAGDLAVPYLRPPAKTRYSSTIAAACVRALALIGSEAASEMLKSYAQDKRAKVSEELCRAYSSFEDKEVFRKFVLPNLSSQYIIRWLLPIEELQYCKNLERLDLRFHNEIANISALGMLTNLTHLNLSGTQVSDISSLGKLTSLTDLDLRGTQVSDISSLEKLTSLTDLDLSGTQVSDISSLGKLASLTYLSLSRTQVSDISSLGKLASLTHLDLSGTQVSDISPLGNLKNLTYLYLDGTQVSDISLLGKLASLTHLYLRGTQVSDISPLADLKRLLILDLRETQVKDITPLNNLKNLSIYLHDSDLDGYY